jgi:alkaline phosphatase D
MRRIVASLISLAWIVAAGVPPAGSFHETTRQGTPSALSTDPDPFPYGVGASDILPTSANLWTQTSAPRIRVTFGTDPTFVSGSTSKTVVPSPTHDGTVLFSARALTPDTTYYYKFTDPSTGLRSRVGQFQTAPAPSTAGSVTFAISGDQDGVPDPDTGIPCSGGDGAVGLATFAAVQAMHPDFYVNLGDTIYSDSSCLPAPDVTVEEYRSSYRTNFSYESFRNLRASTGFYTGWDDHEVRNDWDSEVIDPELLANGTQAFTEYDGLEQPDPNLGFYRHWRWGSEVEFFLLDERSFRTTEAHRRDADMNGVLDCTNPVSGEADLAPTLSQSWRDFFAAQIPGSGLDQPVPAQCTTNLNDPNSSMLGSAQRARFLSDLAASTATFKIVLNEDPIQQIFALPYDRWEGYRWERNAILRFVDRHDIGNVVWLTTDIHAALAHTVDYNTDTPGTTGGVQGMIDYTVGPIATFTFRSEINSAVGDDTASSVRAFLINVNENTCSFLGGDGNPGAPWYNFGLVTVDASAHTISVQPFDFTGTKIAANGVQGAGRDVFCYDYTATAS